MRGGSLNEPRAARYSRALLRAAVILATLTALLHSGGGQRHVNPLLPWHGARSDGSGKLLAWYRPALNQGYDRVLRLGWNFIEHRVKVDRRAGVRVYLSWAVYQPQTLQGKYWQHNPAFLYAAFVDSLVAWYPYSGDERAVNVVRGMLDYQLAEGTTPYGWAWPAVPFATSCGGARKYGGCLAGLPPSFGRGVEPDKVGLLGLGYLRFYELTGNPKYLRAAVRAATALARNVRAGGATKTPWPFRVDGKTGRVLSGAQYGGLVTAPIELLDDLVQLRAGPVKRLVRARDLALKWLFAYPLRRGAASWNRWGPFYEDTAYNARNRNQFIPTMTARYLLTHPDVENGAQADAGALLTSVLSEFGRGPFLGARGIDEQHVPGRSSCCSRAGLGSDTSRWAAIAAMLAAQTDDPGLLEQARLSLNYATYFTRNDGRVSCCGVRKDNEYWFSDGYADYLRSFNWAMAAVPAWAPAGQSHLLGSTSVVQSVTYAPGRISYRTFDRNAVETLRLAFRPQRVLVGSRVVPRLDTLSDEGYTVEDLPGGDFAVHVQHDSSRDVTIAAAAQ